MSLSARRSISNLSSSSTSDVSHRYPNACCTDPGTLLLRLRLFAQRSPRLSAFRASRPLMRQILERLLVTPSTGFPVHAILTFFLSPSVNDPPFSSTSAANSGLTSLQNVTHLRSALRVMVREQISSGTTVNSHPFLFGLHPVITFFATKDIDPDSLCFSFLPKRDSLGLLLLLSGSAMSASSLCSLGGWPSPTLGSAGRGCGSDIATGHPVAS